MIAELAGAFASGSACADLGATYVDLDLKTWTAYTEADHPSAMHLSSNYGSLVVLDRAVAIPRGITFLGGHAARHIANPELERFQRDFRGLVLRGGGGKGLAKQCQPWLDRGSFEPDELADFIEQVGVLAVQARTGGLDLFLAAYPPP